MPVTVPIVLLLVGRTLTSLLINAITSLTMLLLAGLLFGFRPTDNALPRRLLPISLVLPLTYGFNAARSFLLRTPTLIPIPYEIGILAVFMFIMVFLGFAAFRRLERRVRVLGTLGQH